MAFFVGGKVWSNVSSFQHLCSLLPTLGGIYIVMLTVHKTVVLLVNLILVADSAQRFGCHVAWV